MRTMLFALMAMLLGAGCQQIHSSSKPPPEEAIYVTVEVSLENSPTFKKLKRRAKDWDLAAYDATNDWVTVDLLSISEDHNFAHRWATLEVQTNVGVILKDGQNEYFDEKWIPEFLPTIPPVGADFPDYRKEIREIQQRAGPSLYQVRLLKVERVASRWFSDDVFYGDTNFLALYEHPVNCVSNAILFLKSATNPEDAKLIVVYSLQRLPLQPYLGFESELIDMAERHQLSSNLFNRAIFPGSEWSTKLQRNYSDRRVKDLISKIEQCTELSPENKAYVKKIASGKAWDDAREFVETGDLPNDSSED